MEDNPFRVFDEDNFELDNNPHDIGLDPKGFENLRAICAKIPSFNLAKLDSTPVPQPDHIPTFEQLREATMTSRVTDESGPSKEQNIEPTVPLRKPILCHSEGPWIGSTNWVTQINDCFGENTDEAKAFIASNIINCIPFNNLANLKKAGIMTLKGRWRSIELRGYDALKMRVLDHYYKDLPPIGYPLGVFAIGHAYLKLQAKQKHEYDEDAVLMSLETIKTHKIGYIALTVGLLLIPAECEQVANIHEVMSTEDMVTSIKHLKLHEKTGYSVFNMLSHLLVGGTTAIEPLPKFLTHHSQLAKFLTHVCVGKDSVNTLEVAISPRASDLPAAEYMKEPEYEPQRLKSAIVIPGAQQPKQTSGRTKTGGKQVYGHDGKPQRRKPSRFDIPEVQTEVDVQHVKGRPKKRSRSQDEEDIPEDSEMIETIEKTNSISGVTKKSDEHRKLEEEINQDDTELPPSEQEAIQSSMQRKRDKTKARKGSERTKEEEQKILKREKVKSAKKAAKEAYKAALAKALKEIETSDGEDSESGDSEDEDDKSKEEDETRDASSDSSKTENTNQEKDGDESQGNEDEEEAEVDEIALVDFSDRALFGTNKSILKSVLDRLQKLEKSHIDTETRMVKYENELNTVVSSFSDAKLAKETRLNRALLKSGAATEKGEGSKKKKKRKPVSEMTPQEAIGTIVTITGKSAKKVKEVAEIFKPGFVTSDNCKQAAEMLKSYFELKGKKHLAQNVKPESLLDPAYLSRCKTAFDIAKAT